MAFLEPTTHPRRSCGDREGLLGFVPLGQRSVRLRPAGREHGQGLEANWPQLGILPPEILLPLSCLNAPQKTCRVVQGRLCGENPILRAGFWDPKANPSQDRFAAVESLVAGEFIRRGDNLVLAGQSGVGKSPIVQSVGQAACVLGKRKHEREKLNENLPQPIDCCPSMAGNVAVLTRLPETT